MQEELVFKRKFLSLLSIAVVGLIIACSYLYKDNRLYRRHNDQLILQNDSLESVNINLRAAVDSARQPRYTKRNSR